MRRLDQELRELDPIDRAAPEPSGEELLERIVAEPVPPAGPAARRRWLELAPVGLAAAAVAAALLVVGLDVGPGDEREVPPPTGELTTPIDPSSVLHYVQRWTFKGSGPAVETETHEIWQAGNGKRERVVYRPSQGPASERVATEAATREFVENHDPPRIVEYDRPAPGPLAAPAGYGLPADVGDPRTLAARAAEGEPDVERLGPGTVRDLRVERFRVGTCPRTLDILDGRAVTAADAARPVIVSLARDTLLPIRVEPLPCAALRGMLGPPAPLVTQSSLPWAQTDYLAFDVLPPTPRNRALLELADHPGARIVSGKAIDRAEERAENGSPTPTATPTPLPR